MGRHSKARRVNGARQIVFCSQSLSISELLRVSFILI